MPAGSPCFGLLTAALLATSACTVLTPLDELSAASSTTTAETAASAAGAGGSGGAASSSTGTGSSSSSSSSSSGGTGGGLGSAYYAELVLQDGPVAYWRLNDTGRCAFADASGHGHDCQCSSGVTLGVEGATPFDTAATFDGTGYASCGNVLPGVEGAPFSVEAWLRFDADGNGVYGRIVSNETQNAMGGQGYAVIALDSMTGTKVGLILWRDNDYVCTPMYFPVTAAEFHHVVAVHDGVDTTIHIDGDPYPLTCNGASIATVPSSFILGRTGFGPSDFFDGTIDEVAVYAKALSANRIQAHYAAAAR